MPTDTNTASSPAASTKRVNALIIDAGPILSSSTTASTYLSAADRVLTTPSVIAEIRDEAARSRLELQWKLFLELRTPKPQSLQFVKDFARRTGDLSSLSQTDLELLALGYEVEVELGGEAELREEPGARVTVGSEEGKKPRKRGGRREREKKMRMAVAELGRTPESKTSAAPSGVPAEGAPSEISEESAPSGDGEEILQQSDESAVEAKEEECPNYKEAPEEDGSKVEKEIMKVEDISAALENTALVEEDEAAADSDSDGGEWITPSNIHNQRKPGAHEAKTTTPTKKLRAAVATIDFAMQNVLLQMNVPLFSPSNLSRITSARTTVLRCHACFFVARDPSKLTNTLFCPRCGGGGTLLRTACSTDANGVFRIHLKKNFQYRNRGNVFSLPKPQHGTASMKGVADAPILREDQKEFQKAMRIDNYRSKKVKDLMELDYLPGIMGGKRSAQGGLPKLGVGKRNPNEVARKGRKK